MPCNVEKQAGKRSTLPRAREMTSLSFCTDQCAQRSSGALDLLPHCAAGQPQATQPSRPAGWPGRLQLTGVTPA